MATLEHKPAFETNKEFLAGGTDVMERRRYRISRGDVTTLAGPSATITWNSSAASIGALATIHAVATDPDIKKYYAGLAQAAGGLATPQIRAMATMGGSLLQRTRCVYYRHPGFSCFKKGGNTCPSRNGHHELGVVFDLGSCVYPHPSTLGMTLMAYEATVDVQGKGSRSLESLYGDGSDPTRDHLLNPGEQLTSIQLAAPLANERASYLRAISRFEAEWPLVEVIVRLLVENNTIKLARVAVGGVATVPLRLKNVEAALEGKAATQTTLEAAAQLAATGAKPLPQTQYKVELLKRTVLEGLERVTNNQTTSH
ncbi:MAG: FAD binding domain-containing protein [Trueperaceae bacterium]